VDEGVGHLSSRRKAAILCVSMGPAGAAEVFRHLGDDVIEQLTVEMAKTSEVKPAVAERVMAEVVETALAYGYIADGGIRYARDVLERAIGGARATEILSRLASAIEATPFEFLRRTPPDQIWTFLRAEHPQTIALVLANLPSAELAGKVMRQVPAELQAEIATRIALMDQTQPDVVKEVAHVMQLKIESLFQAEYAAAGGVQSLADILTSADRTTERNVLESLEAENKELADQVRSLLFVFEDILSLDARSTQLVLKDVDAKDLAVALRGTNEDVSEHIMANMSERAGVMLREEMELMPPQRKRAIEEAQSKIVATVRRLEDAGDIIISRGAGDEEAVI